MQLRDGPITVAAAHDALGTRVFDAMLIAMACVLGFLLLGPLLTIPLHIPLSYNEGWNAYFSQRAMGFGNGPLYPARGSFVLNNYPPLSFYVTGVVGLVLGDMIVAGRLVATASLFASAALLGFCVRRMGGGARARLAAAAMMLLFSCTFFGDYIAMDDPQWLAQAISLAGLAVLLRRWRQPADLPMRDVALAALLVLAGGIVKHNVVALPLAVTIWLAVFNRRALLVWVAVATAGLAVVLGASWMMYGPSVFADVLQHQRVLKVGKLPTILLKLVPLVPLLGVAGIVLRRARRRDPPAVLMALFAGIAVVTGVTQRLGDGVYYNAHFETLVSLCLAFGVALSQAFSAATRSRPMAAGLLAVASIPIVVALPFRLDDAWARIDGRLAREAAWKPVIAALATSRYPAICETLSLCYWARQDFTLDMFNVSQSAQLGSGLDRQFGAAAHEAGRFGLIQFVPSSTIHRDAVYQSDRDLLMDGLAGLYRPVAAGPEGTILLDRIPQLP